MSEFPSGSRNSAMWQTTGVERLTLEADAPLFERLARGRDIVDVQRYRIGIEVRLYGP
jgi:hypothetical protein